MLQLYTLSVVCNLAAGFLLLYGDGEKSSSFSGGFRMIVGAVAAGVGLLKLFVPVGRPPILGDLLPAVVGMAAGFALVYGFYRERGSASDSGGRVDGLGDALLRRKKALGVAGVAVAALHFLFPGALFL